jgi:hypothetical protein
VIYDVAAAFVLIGAVFVLCAAIGLIADLIDWHEDMQKRRQERDVRRHFYKTMRSLDMHDTEMPDA